MSRDGGNVQQISANMGGIYAPELSPDGRYMVYTAFRGGRQSVWVMDLLTRDTRQLTDLGNNAIDPTWSPDGQQIAFASDAGGSLRHYLINLDGTGLRSLPAEDGLANIGGRIDWSPDGAWLAIYAGPRGRHDIYLLPASGSERRQLTDSEDNLAPSFSPDGQWLVFTSYRADDNAELYIMRPDGSDVRRLTFNNYADWQPRWGTHVVVP